MNYDPQKPVAVFLGPSLARSEASRMLPANYYPPARMGDIYRLLASGVRLIVLIDGLFHSTASIWPREILEALANGIAVVGAASMGALRAAELHRYGMRGCGTIFEWYRDGVIEGDDEVALHHADESFNFRPLSEPLVNLRWTLRQAAAQNCLSPEEEAALLEYARAAYYADRSYDLLLNSSLVKKWPQPRQAHLRHFVTSQAVDLKRQDAIGALCYAADLAQNQSDRPALLAPVKPSPYYSRIGYLHRGFLRPGGDLISGETLLAQLTSEQRQTLEPVVSKNFFLLLWAKERNIECPPAYLEIFRQNWFKEHLRQEWPANGLTGQEIDHELAQRALLQWLGEQGPALDFAPYRRFLAALGAALPLTPAELGRQAAEVCFLAAWARENGLACPPAETAAFINGWEAALKINNRAAWLQANAMNEAIYLALLGDWSLAAWLVKKQPAYFGYTSWSLEVALLKELQITGQTAGIISLLSGSRLSEVKTAPTFAKV